MILSCPAAALRFPLAAAGCVRAELAATRRFLFKNTLD
jgi:hypothetical protein